MPVLEAILHQFPFRIRGFHSDNGSEFLNYKVQQLLNKLLVPEFTKSRANRTTDNALVEGKNGAVVRKHIGHEPIAARHAGQVQRFYMADFNPYLNYHRPCGFATIELSDNGQAPPPLPAQRLSHAVRKTALAQRLGELPEGRRQRGQTRATGAADERHRVRATDAATQKKTAGRLPRAALELPRCWATALPSAGLTAPDSTLRGGERGSSKKSSWSRQECAQLPPPPCPPPLSKPSILSERRSSPCSLPFFRPDRFQAHPWIGKCCGRDSTVTRTC